jgi:hypothetical protein
MTAALRDMAGQPAGDAEHGNNARHQNDEDDPGEDVVAAHV